MTAPNSPTPVGFGKISTSLRMNRGTVGHTTFGFVAACVVSACSSIAAFTAGQPAYAIAAMIIPFIPFFGYQIVTWYGVTKNPDAAMTGDADFVVLNQARLAAGAKHPEIIQIDQQPVPGANNALIASLTKIGADQ